MIHDDIRQEVHRFFETGIDKIKVKIGDLALLLSDRDAAHDEAERLKLRLDAALAQVAKYQKSATKEK